MNYTLVALDLHAKKYLVSTHSEALTLFRNSGKYRSYEYESDDICNF